MRRHAITLLLVVAIVLAVCAESDEVVLSNDDITLEIPKNFVVDGSSSWSWLVTDPPEEERTAAIVNFDPLRVLPKSIAVESKGPVHVILTLVTAEDMENVLSLNAADIDAIASRSGRFANSVFEPASYGTSIYVFETPAHRKQWTVIDANPPREQGDLVARCADLELFTNCQLFTFVDDGIGFEITIDPTMLPFRKDVVSEIIKVVDSWRKE